MALTVDEISKALKAKGGNVADAAKALNVTRQALYKRIHADETLQEVATEQRESFIDLTESALLKQVKRGNTAAIIFTLKTIGKERGYVERVEQKQIGEQILRVVYGDDGTNDKTA